MQVRSLQALITLVTALFAVCAPSALADSVTQTVTPTAVQSGSTPLATQFLDATGVANPTYVNTVHINGAQHQLDPSTVKAPASSEIEYSSDNVFWGPTGSTASRYVRFSGPVAAGAGAVAPVGAAYTGTVPGAPGGDGFAPILTATRVFNVNHHLGVRVECHELSDGSVCAGYPYSYPNGAVTGFATGAVVDVPSGHLWAAAQRPGNAGTETGFACISVGQDSATPPSDCGWVATGTGAFPTVTNSPGNYGGSLQSGDAYDRKLYAIDSLGAIQCVDMATSAACAGQPYNVGLPASDPRGIQLTRIGNTSKFIARVNPPVNLTLFDPPFNNGGATGPSSVQCFDAATGARCAGWSATPILMGGGANTVNGGMIPAQTGSTWDTFCGFTGPNQLAPNLNNDSLAVDCRKLSDGSTEAVPAGLGGTALTGGQNGWQFGWAGLGRAASAGTRVYFAMWRFTPQGILGIPSLEANDRLVCYDFATDSVCPNYPSDFFGGKPGMNPPMSQTYATEVDATGTCVWTLGDPGVMVQRDATNPSQPCRYANISQDVVRADSYCGTTPGDVATAPWKNVRIRNVEPGTDYQVALLTIQDKNGAIVPGWDHVPMSGTTADISAIPATGATSELRVTVEFGGVQSAPFNSGDSYVETTWDSTELPRTCVGSTVLPLNCPTVADGMSFDTSAYFIPSGLAAGPQRTDSDALTRTEAEQQSCYRGTVKLDKVWVGTPGVTTLNIGNAPNGTDIASLQTGASGAQPQTTGTQTLPMGTYYVSEADGLANYLPTLVCTKNGAPYATTGGAVTLAADKDAVVCTLTNREIDGQIHVDKAPKHQSVFSDGTAHYTYAVTNPGTTPIHDVTVTDDKCSPLTLVAAGKGGDTTPDTLDPADTWKYECSVPAATLFAGSNADVTNTVTANGKDELDKPVTDTDTAVTHLLAKVTIKKVVSNPVDGAGPAFGFASDLPNHGTFSLEHNDSTSELVDVTGETTYTVAENDASGIAPGYRLTGIACTNASGAPVATTTVDLAKSKVAITPQPGSDVTCVYTNKRLVALQVVVKTPKNQAVYRDETATYRYAVTNNGTSDLTNVVITDDKCPSIQGPDTGADTTPAVLNPGETWTYSCSIAASLLFPTDQSPAVTNTVTVTAKDELGRTTTPSTDTALTTLLVPGIALDKQVAPESLGAEAGDAVRFTIVATNIGNTALTTVNLTDDLCPTNLSAADKTGDATPAALDPGESWRYTCVVQTTAAQAGKAIVNTAGVSGTDTGGRIVTASDSAEIKLPAPVGPTGGLVGKAKLTGTSGCVRSAYATSTISGQNIQSVRFYVNGKKVRTISKANSGKNFRMRLRAAGLRYGTVKVVARVQYVSGAAPRTVTLNGQFSRCRPRHEVKPGTVG